MESSSPEETRRLGQALGRAAEAGDVVLLSGQLGAGKTVFVQGMARGLDFHGPVSSKSFVLLGEYAGRITLFHADLYRLESPAEVQELALDEISRDGVLVVEWPERGGISLSEQHLTLRFEVTGPETRRITTEPTGARARALAQAINE